MNKSKIISPKRYNELRCNVGKNDEYSEMAWGSKDDIIELLDYIDELEKELEKQLQSKKDIFFVESYCGIKIEKLNEILTKDSATVKEAFIIDELQKYMDLTKNPPVWVEPVRLRLQEKEDWKRITIDIINKLTKGYGCDCQGGDCPCCAVLTFKNKLIGELQ